MKGCDDKVQLIRRIQASHRQLERALFLFQRSPDGGLEAGSKTRYTSEEMTTPGVAGNWSMLDLLNHIYANEQRFVQLCRSGPDSSGGSSLMVASMGGAHPTLTATAPAPSLEQVLARFHRSYREVLDAIQSLPAEALFSASPIHPASPRLLVDEAADSTYRCYDRARDQIRNWQQARLGRSRTI